MIKISTLVLILISFTVKAQTPTPASCLSRTVRASLSLKFLHHITANNGCENLNYDQLNQDKATKQKLIDGAVEELKTKKLQKNVLADFDEDDSGEISAEELCPYLDGKVSKGLGKVFDEKFKDDLTKCPDQKAKLQADYEKLHTTIDYLSADLSSVCLDLKTMTEKFEESVKNCKPETAAEDEKPTCEKAQVVNALAELMAKDGNKILNQQRRLTLLKLARATAEGKHNSLEGYINKEAKELSNSDHGKIRENLVKLYQSHGKFDDVENLKKLMDKKDYSYWNKRTRLQDKDLSIMVMAHRSGVEDSDFTEADSAIIWANSLMTENLPVGSAQANRLLLSGEVARLRGSIAGHSEVSAKKLEEDLQSAEVDLKATVDALKEELLKDPALADCSMEECSIDGSKEQAGVLAEAMLKAVSTLEPEDLIEIAGKPYAKNVVKIVAKKTSSQKKAVTKKQPQKEKVAEKAPVIPKMDFQIKTPIDNTAVKKPVILPAPIQRQPASRFKGFGGGGGGGGGAGSSW